MTDQVELPAPSPGNRISSLDLLKGLVMVIMALDHTRDYFYSSFSMLNVTDPEHTTPALFFTRWITHFCAPTFSLLAGVSAWIMGRRMTKAELSMFLIKRGLWLILLEMTVICFAWYFDVQYRNNDLAVIWSLGISMIFLALFIHLPAALNLFLSLVIIAGHNLLDNVHFEGNLLWSMLHEPASFPVGANMTLHVFYPAVPWIGVMSLGYWLGRCYGKDVPATHRKKLFNGIGVSLLLGFLAIRWTNFYGEPANWRTFPEWWRTLFSFFHLSKYPPSFLYLAATLTGTFFFLANSEKWKGRIVDFFSVFGRVPFFYYVLHLYLIHGLAMLAAELSGFGWEIMVQTGMEVDLQGFGVGLGAVYLIWASVILLLYPLCRWFDRHKRAHKERWWLSYL
ncbi:MAG: DUF1624 domain-containing protein [Bacteroidota bacterium]|nr:DUF1624 domain-containing protein [Bacteroidia bacterium]MBP7438311.1 DUF1624 domain-containing protein [Bacteroidia bacterium]MBP7728615.1 DUF1624 domain-containing protein [Bacteroidia bacterium]MBP7773277.1 DUF1624 domain-containing protein [Bacteroidia bacterium]